MIYSYYFNPEKTERIIMESSVTSYSEQSEGKTRVGIALSIEENINGRRISRNSAVQNFNFPARERGNEEPDFDVKRRYFKQDNKWALIIENHRTEDAESLQTELISLVIQKEPLGLDLYHTREDYEFELRANTLNRLPSSTKAPMVRQAIANHAFTSAGHPEGFYSNSSNHDSNYRAYQLSDFYYLMPGTLPQEAKKEIEFNLAPLIGEVRDQEMLMQFEIIQGGILKLYDNRMEWHRDGEKQKQTFFDVKVLNQTFYDNGFLNRSRMKIQLDKDAIIIGYNGKEMLSTIEEGLELKEIHFDTGYKNEEDEIQYVFLMNQFRINIEL